MNEGSYHVSSFSANMQAEIRRLDAQVDLFWRTEKELLLKHGLRDGIDYLDCGCGPGRLIELVKSTFPTARCSGVEMDPILVDAANAKMQERGLFDCRITQGTAESPGLPAESYDFITMRLVLEHIPDPVAALQSLRGLLRPGGRIFIISNDFEYHTRTWPPVPELDRLYEAYCASRRKDHGDPCIGRRVPRLLKLAGFGHVAQEIELAHNAILGDEPFLKAEGVGIPAQLVSSGFLEQSVFESMIRSWKTMLAHPDHAIMRQLFIAVGERTTIEPGSTSDDPETTHHAAQATSAAPAAFRAPGGELEEKIAGLWRRAMRVERVSVDANFFDLGGDSLMLEEVHTALREELGYDIQIATLFQYPTVEGLAEYLQGLAAPTTASTSPGETAPGDPAAPAGAADDVELQAQRRREAMARRKRPGA